MVRELVDGVPGATFAAIEGTADLPNVEHPAAFNALVRSFLDTLGQPSAAPPVAESA